MTQVHWDVFKIWLMVGAIIAMGWSIRCDEVIISLNTNVQGDNIMMAHYRANKF